MLDDILYFVLVAFISYFVGTINFSKIIAWHYRRKDITKVGSGNPGTMNMLRSFGFVLALATFVAEVVKSGLTCFVFQAIFPQYGQLIYFVSGFFILLGYIFPVWSKFKGGKGVACFAGIFLFSSLWYVGLGWFVVCFILFLFVSYACMISFTYIGGLSIAYTLYIWLYLISHDMPLSHAIAITAIIWVLYALMLFMHRGNIKRLITHTENKIDFKSKLKAVFCHKKGEQIIEEDQVSNAKPEAIVSVDEQEKSNSSDTSQKVEQETSDIKNGEPQENISQNNGENK